jgi:hypothetical protein
MAVLPAETSGTIRRNGRRSENFAYQYLKYLKGSLTCRKILQRGTSGFTSHPKEGVLLSFITVKNPETSEWKIIKCGVRQGCSLSPLLFIIYMNKIIQKWKVTRHGNIPINRNININTMFFADDQVLLAKSEEDLQYSVRNLNKIASEFSMEINAEKTRVMAFREMEPIRSKICINNKTLKQQNTLITWDTTYPMKERKI